MRGWNVSPPETTPADLSVDALDNDDVHIDFRPLYQCIHIYEALDCKSELQRSYQEDRKVSII
jgi:hypothetical protein